MAEYLEHRCCMCPQHDSPLLICPGMVGTLHPNDTHCRFVKVYRDNRGWEYYVRAGLGQDCFKPFYLKPGKSGGGHGCRNFEWRKTFDEAQADLNRYAKKNRWAEVLA